MRHGDPRNGHRYRQLCGWAKATFAWACVYCGRPIPRGHAQGGLGCTLAHRIPVSVAPELALSRHNVEGLAHRACNSRAGNRMPAPRPQSRDW